MSVEITMSIAVSKEGFEKLQADKKSNSIECNYGTILGVKEKNRKNLEIRFLLTDEAALRTDIKKSTGFFDAVRTSYGKVFMCAQKVIEGGVK